jgi:MYXO-CTERM domain-containing protein
MNRLLCFLFPALALVGSASPTLAHVTVAAAPHWHASDTYGLVAAVALGAAAAWLIRRRR